MLKKDCYELSLKCKGRKDFQIKYSSAYNQALKNKWLDDFFGELKQKPRGFWTYEKCYESAKKCKSKKEFCEKFPHAYSKSVKNKWINNFIWFITNPKGKDECNKQYVVYVYEDKENTTCYVGLTKNLKKRILTHKYIDSRTKQYDVVYNYFMAKYNKIPDPIIKNEKLNLTEAQYFEDYWCDFYRKNKWNVLNRAKTGINTSSYGSTISSKYTLEYCYNEAKKYKNNSELQHNNPNLYINIVRNKWLSKMPWLQAKKPNNYWSYDLCLEYAKKCKTHKEFKKLFNEAYLKSRKEHWIEQWDWLEPIHKDVLSKEECIRVSKKYKTYSEFRNKEKKYWKKSYNNDWLKEFVWLQNDIHKPYKFYTYEECKAVAEQYPNRESFKQHSLFKIAKEKGWIDDWEWLSLIRHPKNEWDNFERCQQEAAKYNSRTNFYKGNQTAYLFSSKNGWLDIFFKTKC